MTKFNRSPNNKSTLMQMILSILNIKFLFLCFFAFWFGIGLKLLISLNKFDPSFEVKKIPTAKLCHRYDHCKCQDPLVAAPRLADEWRKYALKKNFADAKKYLSRISEAYVKSTSKDSNSNLKKPSTGYQSQDVVFIGDDVVEQFVGRMIGSVNADDAYRYTKEVFTRLFAKDRGGTLNGLVQGVMGDRITNVLYRLVADDSELIQVLPYLRPKVWWIHVGINDIMDGCSSEAIVEGIKHLVQQIQTFPYQYNYNSILNYQQKPKIVISALLPSTNLDNGGVLNTYESPTWKYISETNQLLEAFVSDAATGGDIVFYNQAFDIFTTEDENDKTKRKIVEDLMPDYLHPSFLGMQVWSKDLVKFIEKLIIS